MKKINNILTLGLQITLTFIVTFFIYMLFALLDSDFGIDGLFGLIIFQPILAVLVSGLTILLCLIVGLPLRINKKLNHFWTTNSYISIIGLVIGFILLFLALLPHFNETVTATIDGQETLKQIPNSTLSILGWFLTAFSLLHILPPHQLTVKLKIYFQRNKK